MPPKTKKTTAAEAASTTKPGTEPLAPGHTRAQGSRQRWDHNGEPITTKPATPSEEQPQ